MDFGLLTRKSLHLFAMVGGWRTVAEVFTSRILFLVVYLCTGHVLTSALVAVGGVLVFAVVRVCTDRKWWQAAGGLIMVGVCALLAGNSGKAVDFYLPSVLLPAVAGVVFLVSMLVRWPLVGLLVGSARGERSNWRRDSTRLRLYQLCTAMFVAKFVLNVALLVPLYLTGQVVALGIASTVGGTPALALCGCLCWRILRTANGETHAAAHTP